MVYKGSLHLMISIGRCVEKFRWRTLMVAFMVRELSEVEVKGI